MVLTEGSLLALRRAFLLDFDFEPERCFAIDIPFRQPNGKCIQTLPGFFAPIPPGDEPCNWMAA